MKSGAALILGVASVIVACVVAGAWLVVTGHETSGESLMAAPFMVLVIAFFLGVFS